MVLRLVHAAWWVTVVLHLPQANAAVSNIFWLFMAGLT